MARYSVAGRSTIAGTAVRASFSLFASATVNFTVETIQLWNTTTTAFNAAVARFAAQGTVGAGLTEAAYSLGTATVTGFAGHTADASPGAIVAQASVGAVVGSSVLFEFKGGLFVPAGVGNGVGVIIPNGTGQVHDYTAVWYE